MPLPLPGSNLFSCCSIGLKKILQHYLPGSATTILLRRVSQAAKIEPGRAPLLQSFVLKPEAQVAWCISFMHNFIYTSVKNSFSFKKIISFQLLKKVTYDSWECSRSRCKDVCFFHSTQRNTHWTPTHPLRPVVDYKSSSCPHLVTSFLPKST